MGYREEQPGLVTSVFQNLQRHLELDYPSGNTDIVDSKDFRDAGEIIWTDSGTAILKYLESGQHCPSEVKIIGVSTRGFCLLQAPDQHEYTWYPPRQPEELGGRNRQVHLSGRPGAQIFAMESFFVDPKMLPEYEDLSGVVVKLQAPERSPRRHRDHLANH
jgi:hypothetical protein